MGVAAVSRERINSIALNEKRIENNGGLDILRAGSRMGQAEIRSPTANVSVALPHVPSAFLPCCPYMRIIDDDADDNRGTLFGFDHVIANRLKVCAPPKFYVISKTHL